MQKTKANNKKSYDIVKSISNKEELNDIFAAQVDYSYLSYDTSNVDIESYLGAFSCSLSENFFSVLQKILCITSVFLLGTAFFFYPKVFISSFLFSGLILHMFLILLKNSLFGSKGGEKVSDLRERYLKKRDNKKKFKHGPDTPTYSILLPVYMEEESVIEQLFTAIYNLDYPKDKLQVLLVLESIDSETIDHVKNIETKLDYDMIIVPNFQPRTKAKACNYALKFVRGKYVVIFDTDDIPDQDQLNIALQKFMEEGDDLVCLQAKLNYYNADENLLTRLFSIEYAILFDGLLPALSKQNYPLPLGGTSNHFKVEFLKKLKGWDIYNLTEDAEIGMRLAANRYKAKVIDSYTAEEAPITLWAWIKQRSRWLKGFIQTYLLLLQKKHNFTNKVGFKKSLVSLHFMLGLSTLSLVMTPIMFVMGLFLKLSNETIMGNDLILNFSILTFLLWILLTSKQVIKVMKKSEFFSGFSKLKKAICLVVFPAYFILHTIAVFFAIFDLIRRPFYWSRTKHGVTKKSILINDRCN